MEGFGASNGGTSTDAAPTRFDADGNALEEAPYYCPACGRRYEYRRECIGSQELPHAPVEVVSTDELAGDPADHTPAPATGQ